MECSRVHVSVEVFLREFTSRYVHTHLTTLSKNNNSKQYCAVFTRSITDWFCKITTLISQTFPDNRSCPHARAELLNSRTFSMEPLYSFWKSSGNTKLANHWMRYNCSVEKLCHQLRKFLRPSCLISFDNLLNLWPTCWSWRYFLMEKLVSIWKSWCTNWAWRYFCWYHLLQSEGVDGPIELQDIFWWNHLSQSEGVAGSIEREDIFDWTTCFNLKESWIYWSWRHF